MMTAALALGLAGGTLYAMSTAPVAGAAALDPYTWRNVEVHGGGFVPGIIFNKTRRDLVYARTDIGGAYRWNPTTGRWIPLNDFTGPADWNLLGVDGLATDPVDPNQLVMVVGEYTQSWAGNAAILRSTNQGASFSRTDLPFKMGGNENGRSMGERLQIDPNRNGTIYLGTRNDGLWRSTDFGATWARVASFPTVGQSGIGIGWIEFDKSSATAGNTTQRIYVGTSNATNPIYRSTDGGTTWSVLAGQPSAGLPHHGKLSANNGTFYVTYGDQPGPYTMANGSVWKMSTSSGAWTNITPLLPWQNGEQGFGYAGLTVDGANANIVMVATMSRWGPVDDIFRSTNGGSTWVSVTARKTMDTSAAPYLNWHATPKLGWMIGSLEIDPFNPNRFLYGTGATIFGTDQATTLDAATGTITISSRAHGLEETAVQELVSPPSGPPLFSALGDIGVFKHDSLTAAPAGGMAADPIVGTATSIDFAEGVSPLKVVYAGQGSNGHVGVSTNGGSTFIRAATEPENPEGAGSIAISANGNTIVWAPNQRGAFRSTNNGGTWTAVTGLATQGLKIRSDRVNSNKFYVYSNIDGRFYVSTNGGASFTNTAQLSAGGRDYFKVVPGVEGEIWLATGTGLFRSTNSGTSFTRIANVTSAQTVGFGRAAPGRTNVAVYINGVVDGEDALFRSDDSGATWVRINDDAHRWGWIGAAITGDPRVYGRVYVSTNGRGIQWGDRGETPPTTPPPTTPPPTTPPPTTPPPTTPAPGGCSATYRVANQWPGGFTGEVSVRNTGTSTINAWTVRWTFANGQVISDLWGGIRTQTGAQVTVRNESWNGTIGPNATVVFGFNSSWSGTNAVPSPVTCTSP